MRRFLYVHVLLCCLRTAHSFCPSQCTCVFHGGTDGTGTRSVLCNDPDMSDIPVNVPVDTVKLRVEKTAVRRIPTEAFYYLAELRYLWITYNSVTSVDTASFYNLKVLHELRMDGNMISLFPWESLREMPRLKTLDLHNNRITNVPVEAIPYILNITYLDLSSNKLATLPADLMDIWPPFNGVPVSANASQKVVLGLQDNPWFCDCKISKLIEISKMTDTPVVLMDLFLTCSGPENLAGVLFQRAELDNCVKPSVMTSATKITSPLGSNVLLRCDATGFPTPALYWAKTDGSPVNNTVQESPADGVRWSIMSLHGIVFKDAGNYSCKAKNVAGSIEATISLSVAGTISTTMPPLSSSSVGTGPPSQNTTVTPPVDVPSSTLLTSTVPLRTLTTPTPPPKKARPTQSNIMQKTTPKQRKKPMKTIEEAAEKDPVIDPYTLGNVEDSGQNQLFMIMSGIACALVLPLIALLIYKILALYCKGQNVNTDEEELEKESYVKFETISMKQRAMNSHPAELWARRQTQESERMLLCSRSSIDSQMTYKSDSSRSEYLC
ncbi:leucine-rich repeat, immunoglobulin-like domain and transmembrane domain-containing protein 3a [Nelusetta ayraudi]|uniref:leucine-rich repeat, immunoglobulin-like domain and transmembrane domain-containing protein 3a n=1 Tax=Nelusetta ayraudi TaxID=303726 RepID=UPI003F720D72